MHRVWLEHYEPGVPKELHYPLAPIHALLEGAAKRAPNRTAIEFMGYRLTYAQLWAQAQRFAAALQAVGVRKGERVAIQLPNCPQQVIAFYGSSLVGAVVVNTSPLYVARELEHQLADSGAETLVTLNLFEPRYREVAERVPVKRVIVTSMSDALPFPKNLLYPVKTRREGAWVEVRFDARTIPWRKFVASGGTPTRVDIQPDDLALLQYTGGTTGLPKGAMLSHRNLMANTIQTAVWLNTLRDAQEVLLGVIPFFHVYGMTVGMNMAVKLAATMVLLPRFGVKEVLAAIDEHHPTIFPGVPTMYVAINNSPEARQRNLSSIHACMSGAAPLPIEVARTFESLTEGHLVEGYGLTEASPVTHVNPMIVGRREGSIGLPLPGVDSRVVDERHRTVAPGEVGELAVSGPNIMQGYWQRPDESAHVLVDGLDDGATPGRWLLTGDMARMDADGYFYVVDRKKDMIDASGFNVYPREVEEVLYEHPAVQEVVVAGVPDAYRGETVKAYIILKPGQSATEAEIIEFTRSRLAAYKVPRQIEFRTELPKTLVGKILRRRLIEEERAKLDAARPTGEPVA